MPAALSRKSVRYILPHDLPEFDDELADFVEYSKVFPKKPDDVSFALHLYHCLNTLNIASSYPNVDTLVQCSEYSMYK